MHLIKKYENKGAEFVDLRVTELNFEAISTDDGKISSIQSSFSKEFSVRVFINGSWGFSYCHKEKDLKRCFEKAFKLAKTGSKYKRDVFNLSNIPREKGKFSSKGSPMDVELEDKLKVVFDVYKGFNLKEIVNKNVEVSFTQKKQEYFNSNGSNLFEQRNYFNFLISITGKRGDKIRRVYERVGKCAPYRVFLKTKFSDIVSSLQERLKLLFVAKKAPAGKLPLVIDNTLAQVFFHEAVGHACEADSIIEKSSVFVGKLGEKVAPGFLTLRDTPKVKHEHGFYRYDDEGVKGKGTVLIKNGVLVNYLYSLETASKLNMKPTGNGRAENGSSFPIPRMSNTVLDNGDYNVEELFEGIKRGIYAKNSSGGIVEPTTGNFLFNAREAYLIENGEITKPLLDVSFGGNILSTLMKIEKIANDQKPSFGGWRCGKQGQMVPVGGASPHIMISEAIVGGSK